MTYSEDLNRVKNMDDYKTFLEHRIEALENRVKQLEKQLEDE